MGLEQGLAETSLSHHQQGSFSTFVYFGTALAALYPFVKKKPMEVPVNVLGGSSPDLVQSGMRLLTLTKCAVKSLPKPGETWCFYSGLAQKQTCGWALL